MRMQMKKIWFLFTMIIVLGLTACSGQQEIDANRLITVYYINHAETKVVPREYEMKSEDTAAQIQEVLEQLAEPSVKLEYKAPLSLGFQVEKYHFSEEKLTLDMDESYRKLPVTLEVLVRAALVRTLTQIDGVTYLSVTIQDEPLADNLDNPVGIMSADMFIDNAGNEINAYEKASLKLYFANEAGDGLVAVERHCVYNSNISLEKLVVEELIKGPNGEGIYPLMSKDTKIVSVSVKDGTCYVNLDKTFLTQPYKVTAGVTIYGITNSLAELSNVNKVQISINGETDIMYREAVSLDTVFERNLELTKKEK